LKMIPWKRPQACPKCGKEAWYSEIFGYINASNGWRIFCPHCGYNHMSERHSSHLAQY
jgi:hypothetical protein